MGKGERSQGGNLKKAILADATEAVIAALYLDQGFESARKFVLSFIPEQVEKVLSDRMAWFAQQSGSARMLLSLRGRRDPTYGEEKTLAACRARAADLALPPGEPLLIGLREDMAKALGAAIAPLLRGRPLVSIDSVQMEDGDYVDLGRPLMNGLVIPVVVKTLLFG